MIYTRGGPVRFFCIIKSRTSGVARMYRDIDIQQKQNLFLRRDFFTERDLGTHKVSHKIKKHNHHLSKRTSLIWTRNFLTSSDSLSKKFLLLFVLCSSPSKSCQSLQKAITTYRRCQERKRIRGKDAFLYLSLHSR